MYSEYIPVSAFDIINFVTEPTAESLASVKTTNIIIIGVTCSVAGLLVLTVIGILMYAKKTKLPNRVQIIPRYSTIFI